MVATDLEHLFIHLLAIQFFSSADAHVVYFVLFSTVSLCVYIYLCIYIYRHILLSFISITNIFSNPLLIVFV